jgi:aspartyl protease family protein
MNKSLSAIALTGSLLLFPFIPATLAQSECFLQGANGQHIDLSRLCGGSSTNRKKPPQVYQLPIQRRVNGIPTVMVVFNDRHYYEMLFDTGASGIVLTDEMAKAMKVKREREVAANTAGGVVTVYLGRINSVKAGDVALSNQVVGISPQMEGLGLLGQTFFGSYDVTIKKDVIELRYRP